MDSWPSYSETATTAPSKAKGKGKDEDKRVESPWRYPVLEPGSLGAATLRQSGKRYEWSFVAEDKTGHRLVPSDRPVEVFPPTRPEPWQYPKVTPLQRAEQGAHFIRTFHPHVDIPTNLMRENITEDDRITRALRNSNMSRGNMLEIASFRTSRMSMAYLAFPMGETNCQLNMSSLVTYAGREAELKPVARPVHTFSTPIRQIVAAPGTFEIVKGKPGPMLGVRTMGATVFLQVNVNVHRNKHSINVLPLATIERSDMGDRHAVDIAISPADVYTAFIATDLGDIYRCVASKTGRTIERLHCAHNTAPVICRLAACETRHEILAISDKTAFVLDSRTRGEPHELHRLSQLGVQLTSIERPGDDHIVRLATTEEILWLDNRNTRTPLLGVRHRRDFDTTLRTQTYILADRPLTVLTSRRNSLVTVYDVASEKDNLLHMRGSPYALPPILMPDGANLGSTLYGLSVAGHDRLAILQLSERGSVSLLNLSYGRSEAILDTRADKTYIAEWPPDIKELAAKAAAKADLGTLAHRAHSIVDLSSAYQRLFVNRDEADLLVQANAAFDTLERMPLFWQDADAPVEHALTTFDIAMRSGDEPTRASRSDWFTGSSLDSAVGYRAMEQGHIPPHKLRRLAPGHWEISSHIRRHVPEFDDDPQKTIENLTHFDLADDPERTVDSFRREAEARSQLALDLSLASDVFMPHRLEKDMPTSFDNDMLSISLSTQAMSLGELEPTPVHFRFLRPILKSNPYLRGTRDEDTVSADSKSITPLGVRLLMQEWDIGTDPEQYVYHDPYDDSPTIPPKALRRSTKGSSRAEPSQQASETQLPTQWPPMVGLSVPHAPPAVLPAPTRKPVFAAQSQDTLIRALPPSANSQPVGTVAPTASQESLPSTQVLPGPHGGRANGVKKKPMKKRLGGF